MATATKLGANDVTACDKGYIITSVQNSSSSTDWTVTCVKGTEISNCLEGTTKHYTAHNVAKTTTCGACKKGYSGSAFINNGITTCAKHTNTGIANCDWEAKANASTTFCLKCKKGYAFNTATPAVCTKTAHANCSNLSATNECQTCATAYYFDATKCILSSGLMKFGGILLMMLVGALFA